jgi:hypothetical protein
MTGENFMLKIQYDRLIADGFDELGALVSMIDSVDPDERYQPTIELLESLGYRRCDAMKPDDGEYAIKAVGGQATEASLRAFFVVFKMGDYVLNYQPINRCLFRGDKLTSHRPESDFRFADWYPTKGSAPRKKKGKIEDQLADDFSNASMAAQFLYDHKFARSNTYKRLPKNTYFVSSRHGDGQPSGIVFRGESKTYFYDYYEDERYEMGASGLLKSYCLTRRQTLDSASLAALSFPTF